MMKKYFLGFIAITFILCSFTLLKPTQNEVLNDNTQEIIFRKISLDEAIKLAKKENKKIFLYAYTDWCQPCKMMQSTTYKDAEVAKYFNSHFINMQVEVEKDANGPDIARRFNVRAHPCLLFVNSDGTLNTTILGYYKGKDLLAKVKEIK